MSESKRIENDDQVASSPVYTESEYQALLKENALLKQALDEQGAREREKTAELKALEDIRQRLVTGRWSDLILNVRGKIFVVQKAILASCSSIFAKLLKQSCNENCLVISDVPVGVFEVLLNFIYTGNVPALEPQLAKDLLTAADSYKLAQLKSATEDYLCTELTTEPVASLLSLAETTNASKLKDKCFEFNNSNATSPTTPPIQPLAHLPDLCLLALLRQLPPEDQISARQVCHRWSVLVPAANRRHPRSLVLAFIETLTKAETLNWISRDAKMNLQPLVKKEDGSPLVTIRPPTKWNSLHFRPLVETTVSQIVATFPVIRRLQLFIQINSFRKNELHCDCCPSNTTTTSPSPLHLLIQLLDHWRHQLTHLTIDVHLYSEHSLGSSFEHLTTAINSLSTLKHLSLHLTWNDRRFTIHLPILSQLLTFTAGSPLSDLADSLQHYVTESSPLTSISLTNYVNTTTNQLISLPSDIRRRIVYIGYPRTDYRSICRHLTSLTTVDFNLSNLESNVILPDLFNHLSLLTQLVDLRMTIRFLQIPNDDPSPRLPLPQLTSVKLFYLTLYFQSHHHYLQRLNLPWTMPNLQVINLVLLSPSCTLCGISRKSTLDEKKHCLRQIFTPLKRDCTQLHTIMHNHEIILGTAEEILMSEPASPRVSNG